MKGPCSVETQTQWHRRTDWRTLFFESLKHWHVTCNHTYTTHLFCWRIEQWMDGLVRKLFRLRISGLLGFIWFQSVSMMHCYLQICRD